MPPHAQVRQLLLLRHSHRSSRYAYAQQQHLIFVLFKEYPEVTYRDVVDLRNLMTDVCHLLNYDSCLGTVTIFGLPVSAADLATRSFRKD